MSALASTLMRWLLDRPDDGGAAIDLTARPNGTSSDTISTALTPTRPAHTPALRIDDHLDASLQTRPGTIHSDYRR